MKTIGYMLGTLVMALSASALGMLPAMLLGVIVGAVVNTTLSLVNVGNSEQPQAGTPEGSSSPQMEQTAPSSSPARQLSSVSPRDIGRILAINLDKSCSSDCFSDEERLFLTSSQIPIEEYHREIFALSGFATDYAIVKLLEHNEVEQEVREGYLSVWKKMSSQDSRSAALYELFLARYPAYAKAAEQLEPGIISSMALTLGEFLGSENGQAQALALTVADRYFFSHVDRAEKFFLETGLLTPQPA